MYVLVARHSTAVDPYAAPSDETRWLTESGRQRMRRVAQAIAKERPPTKMFVSPLVRAVQTAEILAGGCNFDGPLEVHPPLAAEYGTSAQALSVLDRCSFEDDEVVALVTHMPKVRILAGHLAGEERMPSFRTGAVCCVRVTPQGGSFQWMLNPETLRFSRVL